MAWRGGCRLLQRPYALSKPFRSTFRRCLVSSENRLLDRFSVVPVRQRKWISTEEASDLQEQSHVQEPSSQSLHVTLHRHTAEVKLTQELHGTSRIFLVDLQDKATEFLSSLKHDVPELFSQAQLSGSNDKTFLEACLAGESIIFPGSGKHLQLQPTRPPSGASLKDMSKYAIYASIRRDLELRIERNISVESFLSVCERLGLSEPEAWEYLDKLRDVGIVLHFPHHEDPKVRNTVFLSPEEVIARFYGYFGLDDPKKNYEAEETERKLGKIRKLEQDIQVKGSQLKELEQIADRWTRRINFAIFVSLLSGTFGYAYLTFEYLSWDIMEPVTYFTASGIAIFGYWWWLFTNTDFRYEAIAEEVQTLTSRFTNNKHTIDDIKTAREVIKKLENRKNQLEKELELLQYTGFDPSIVKFQRNYQSLQAVPEQTTKRDKEE
eukprot:gb/GECG01007886.1/.p1 GENE.gb/GECG01007886.1/~~gb/GECG01007886.1/.p1  ORF type:complete len:437 (+),score=58.76 gb/GECG01007886.1/:1-1311(+)